MTHPTEAAPIPPLNLDLVHNGKVRDIYRLDEGHLVLVTSDRLSAFDVGMMEPIPNKGRVLSAMTAYWFDALVDVVPNHRASLDAADIPEELSHPFYRGRTDVVRQAEMLPIECIVRSRLTGSALKPYKATGLIHGEPAPAGLVESSEFPEPMFTPSTKAAPGKKDENISFDEAANIVGQETAEKARHISLEAFRRLRQRAEALGIIVADTKFELGFIDGELTLCDEVGTPDSSRFWPADKVILGQTPPSFDKQPFRDYLTSLGWDKKPPAPQLPLEIITATSERYVAAYERITDKKLADWPGIHVRLGNLALDNQ